MFTVPCVRPSTEPPTDTEAIELSAELHEPPAVASAKAVVVPEQTVVVPVMAAGVEMTVSVLVAPEEVAVAVPLMRSVLAQG